MSKRNKHHRRPKSLGGTDTYPRGNVKWVNSSSHILWHKMFKNMSVYEIVDEINSRWLDPAYQLKLEKVNDRRRTS